MTIKKIKNVILLKNDLIKILKITDPFILLDKVEKVIPGKNGTGIKNLAGDEWFFKCHLIGEPMMPGTLQTEAMLQTIISVIYFSLSIEERNCLITKSSTNFFSKINKKGEMIINAEILNSRNGAVEAKATIFFNKKKVSDGIFKFFDPNKLNI